MLPQLRSVVSPVLQDCPSLLFPDTSLTVLQAIVTLGIDSDKFTKVGFSIISLKS